MTADDRCHEIRELAAELALGIADGKDRADARTARSTSNGTKSRTRALLKLAGQNVAAQRLLTAMEGRKP